MSPAVSSAKIFLKKLWALKLDWDAAVPAELHTKWNRFRQELNELNDIKIPRHVLAGKVATSTEIHAFSDASQQAYGVAIYIRSTFRDGTVVVRLLCAKSRVAPAKTVSIPRLELCAAKLATQLVTRVKADLKWQEPCFFWTDSEVVLAWINSSSSSHHTFVANRVAAIQEVTTAKDWRHVASEDNPADLITREISPRKLKDCTMWFYGPMFLHGSNAVWKSEPMQVWHTELEKKQEKVVLAVTSTAITILEQINHRNSFTHLQRVIAYLLRYYKKLRPQVYKGQYQTFLSVEELNDALMFIVRTIQQKKWALELTELRKGGEVNSRSSILSLNPFLDHNGVLRVGGRIQEANISYDAKHPVLLPYGHFITRLLFSQVHRDNSHAGAQTLLNLVRQRFWPVKGKTIARSVVQECVDCRKAKPQLLSQFIGNLPAARVQPARPFINSGVDFCGPFSTYFKIRGKRPVKSYVAIFCCFATKAVHIEVVSDLTTDAFIAALKRFIGRRGHCRNLYSDNATNFVGANNQLQELQNTIYGDTAQEQITKFCSNKGIDFHFIPPRAPHFGGLWEAAIKSAKHLFQKSVGAASLTYEELETTMIEIEAILNSRPLTPMSTDPSDLSALTPGHFLIGEPLVSIVDPHAYPSRGSLSHRWKVVTQLKNEFWQRWTKEYLCELQHRAKWHRHCANVKPGTMVIIKEDNVPVLSWPLGRITQTIKGKDGVVRVADVKTTNGILRRAIHRLAPLPVEQEDSTSADMSHEDAELPPKNDNHDDSSQPRNRKRNQPDNNGSSSTTSEKSSRGKRSRTATGVSALSLLMTTSFLLVTSAMPNPRITINPFTSQPGLYFENTGITHLSSNEWTLVVFYDMTTYWKELEFMISGTTSLSHICNNMTMSQPCNDTVDQFLSIIDEIRNNNELLSLQPHRRTRRAPLDIIGNIASSLFGVLDSTYADHMSQIINDVDNNEHHMMTLLKNQTSIIDSTVNIMKKSQERAEQQMKDFNNYFNTTVRRLNGLIREQQVAEVVNALSTRLILTIANYQRIQATLLDVIIDTHHGKVSPLLLSPKQLQSQLAVIKENLPSPTTC